MRPDDLPTSAPPDETASPPAPGTLEDEEIFCPVCGYNLTGNLTGRCSECGSLFDRAQLLVATRISADALMPWERADEFSFRERFWKTLRISLFHPEKFALAFSVQPNRSRSASFCLICMSLITANALTIGLLTLLSHRDRGVDDVFSIVLPLLVVVPILPVNLAVGLLYAAAYPHADRKHHLRPWLAIVEYATAHWLLTWAAPVLALLLAPMAGDLFLPLLWACTISVWIGCSILWAYTLVEVVRWRTAMGRKQTHALGGTLLLAWAVWIGTLAGLVYLAEEIL